MDAYAKWLKNEQDDTVYSLKYNDYISELEKREKYVERFKSVFEYDSKLAFQSLQTREASSQR